MANATAITLRALSAAAENGEGDTVDIGESRSAATVNVAVAAITGTNARLDVSLQTSPDGTSGWRVVAKVGQLHDARRIERAFIGLDRFVRVVWSLTSGAEATFSADGEAHTVYANRADLKCSSETIARAQDADPDAVARALILMSSAAESELVTAVGLALTKWPGVLRSHVANMAAYELGMRGGFQGAGIDEFLVKAHDDAMSWLKRVGKREAHMAGVEPAHHAQVRLSSGNATAPNCYPAKFSDNWGDF